MIDVDGVTRRYGDFTALDAVSLHIGQGEIVGLLGHNGAGKTTLMKMITGYLEPTAGSIRVDGHEVTAEPRAVQALIGYLPENCPLYPEMTVMAYLDFQAGLHGLEGRERETALARAVRLTELAPKALEPIQNLSRGYRQRVGVAQAILHRPRILILDEPTNGLDPTQILHMRRLIRDLAAESTVIVSTHILQEVQAVCERVVILHGGRKVVDARLDELQQAARLQVTLDRPEAEARPVLERLAPVAAVEEGDGRFTYLVETGPEQAPAIGRAVQEAGFALYGLCPERRDLERVFAEAGTAGEVRHAA
ncbi:MAG: ATP-binding cassette domain-containing protein [Gammaproteobacteria bacterium]|nr:MAG: ATP-binding cassette domain-containing protein [Gammaproteobacteria bacterium]